MRVETTFTPSSVFVARFLLFEGDDYYPDGGWLDFTGAYPTLAEAQEAKTDHEYDGGWAHVVDTQLGVVVSHKNRLAPWTDGIHRTDFCACDEGDEQPVLDQSHFMGQPTSMVYPVTPAPKERFDL